MIYLDKFPKKTMIYAENPSQWKDKKNHGNKEYPG
jgi:hypothetical protein